MQEKNYTNPEDRGRFGFSMSGEYRTPYRAETFLVTALIGIAAIAGVILFLVVKQIVDRNRMEQESSTFFVSIAGVIALALFAAILIIIFGVGVRNVKKGFLCQYSANDETFTTTIGGDLHVIQYKDVSGVHFQARTSMGKIRGYDVVVKVNGKEERFSICSDGYLSPQATPFYIIQERLDILRQPRPSAQINNSRADTKAITRAEVDRAKTGSISAMDRMAQLLGETSNMPELSLDASPSQQAAARVTQVINEYSSDEMPAIGAPKRQAPAPQIIIDSDGREKSQYDIQAQGTFYMRPKLPVITLIVIAALAVWGSLLYLIFAFTFTFGGGFSAISFNLGKNTMPYLIVLLVTSPFPTCLAIIKTRGSLCSYKADGRGFYLTIKGKGNEQVLYKDVLSIDYTPTKLLWGDRGYKVDILTTYGLIQYDYTFPRFNHKIARQYLPFEVIRKNMPSNKHSQQ